MSDSEIQLPRAGAAIERLERAVFRLEGVLADRGGEMFLGAELTAVREDYARLDATAGLVEERLDGVIDRLKTILED